MPVCPHCGIAYLSGETHQCVAWHGWRRGASVVGMGLLAAGVVFGILAILQYHYDRTHGAWITFVPFIVSVGLVLFCAGLVIMAIVMMPRR
jgi:hypothetical protein